MSILPTVSVAVPAYNEENNIQQILQSLLYSTGKDFVLKEILVYCDGSTDNTVSIVTAMQKQYSLIKLFCFPERRGKVFRLNQIFRQFRADYLLIFDADIKLAPNAVWLILQPALADKLVNMVAAHQVPLRPENFIGKIIYAGYKLWDNTRLKVNHGDYIQNFYGAATCYRGAFAKALTIPKSITDERGYLYLSAKQNGKFIYQFSALIYYWPVSTLSDFFALADRSFGKNRRLLIKYFGTARVNQAYALPLRHKLGGILETFHSDPFFVFSALILNLLTRIIAQKDAYYHRGMWSIANSTKAKFEDQRSLV